MVVVFVDDVAIVVAAAAAAAAIAAVQRAHPPEGLQARATSSALDRIFGKVSPAVKMRAVVGRLGGSSSGEEQEQEQPEGHG